MRPPEKTGCELEDLSIRYLSTFSVHASLKHSILDHLENQPEHVDFPTAHEHQGLLAGVALTKAT
jgi:hypothetical protein